MTSPFSLDRQHTALLMMDYQQEIVANVIQQYPHLLDHAADTLAAARAANLPVIYIVVQFREGYPEISPRNRSFSAIREAGRLLIGTPAAEIHPQVAPRAGEVVLTKHRVGAFSTTPLETILCAHDITTLVLCGVSTSGVVLSTLRSAADMDYDLVVVEDCCAEGDAEVHRVLMQKLFPRQARVVSSREVIDALT